jgi:hypothetical protein
MLRTSWTAFTTARSPKLPNAADAARMRVMGSRCASLAITTSGQPLPSPRERSLDDQVSARATGNRGPIRLAAARGSSRSEKRAQIPSSTSSATGATDGGLVREPG